jgi:hypothetical protein
LWQGTRGENFNGRMPLLGCETGLFFSSRVRSRAIFASPLLLPLEHSEDDFIKKGGENRRLPG